jgi:hypothetical protein
VFIHSLGIVTTREDPTRRILRNFLFVMVCSGCFSVSLKRFFSLFSFSAYIHIYTFAYVFKLQSVLLDITCLSRVIVFRRQKMKHFKHFLHSKAAKTSMANVLIIIVVVAGGYFLFQGGYLDNLLPGFSITGGSGGVDVNKKLQFTWSDEWSGTVANAKTFYVYDESFALKETLTTAATGIVASAQNYPSGTNLHVKFLDTNDKIWYSFTVPTMSATDAESSTYNDVAFKDFEIGTYTSDTLKTGAYSIVDAQDYNQTGNTTTPIFVYTLANSGADNTGILESYDPVYAQQWGVWITGTITNSSIIVTGVDYQFTVGTVTYFADKISASELSLWKVGPSYMPGFTGTASVSFGLDLTGYTTSDATMQITAYAYADPSYAMSHAGNYGTAKLEIAEQTITIET